jgi:hypothetical protein
MSKKKHQPFGFPRSNARGMLSLPAGRQGLILSGVFDPSYPKGRGLAPSKHQFKYPLNVTAVTYNW